MQFNQLIPELYVSDFAKSLNFYTNILPFKIEYSRDNPQFAFLSYQGSQLMIQIEDNNPDWNTDRAEYPYGRGINFQIDTDNVQGIVASLSQYNYPLKRNIKDSWYRSGNKEYGCREILVMDPDGYLLRFSQDTGERVV